MSDDNEEVGLWDFFLETVKGEGLDVRVLRTRLYVEHIIDKVLEQEIEGWETVLEINPRFRDKVELLNKVKDVDSGTNINIQKINELRNIVAHSLDVDQEKDAISEKISEMEAVALGNLDHLGRLPDEYPDSAWEINMRAKFDIKARGTVMNILELDKNVLNRATGRLVEDVQNISVEELEEKVADKSRFDDQIDP